MWVFFIGGALIIVRLERFSRVLSLAGLWMYLLFTAATVLSAAVAVMFGIIDLLGMTRRSNQVIAQLWGARIIKVVESAGMGFVTWLLYRHFYPNEFQPSGRRRTAL